MTTKFVHMLLIRLSIISFSGCNSGSLDVPIEFRSFIADDSIPVEYREINPFPGGVPEPIPAYIARNEALEDIRMFEYLVSTSYSGYEYWEHEGVDFGSYFAGLRDFVNDKDSVLTFEFEAVLSEILDQLRDGHIMIEGHEDHRACKHKSVCYSDILVERAADGPLRVISSQNDMVKVGDLFTQKNSDQYLFRTLSSAGEKHYLIGELSFDAVSSRDLSFNDSTRRVPFHESRLVHAAFDDPEPYYIDRDNEFPIVRVTSFADQLGPDLQGFMQAGSDLKAEEMILVNVFDNGGGMSVFPQSFLRNLNGSVQWETRWATLESPGIVEFYSKHDVSTMPELSSDFKGLIEYHRTKYESQRTSPVTNWVFASTHSQDTVGDFDGTLILMANRRVSSAGENLVGASQSIKNRLVIGENTGGSAQFSSTCGYYLPNSKIIAHLPRQLILIPGLEECVGYLPDYWLDTREPLEEVKRWLADPDNYQFEYSISYIAMLQQTSSSPALPDDVDVVAPSSKVPEALRGFSGRWFGVAEGILEHMLVVERIDDRLEVDAIYSRGVAYQWGITEPGWSRYRGTFENQSLVLRSEGSKLVITYELISDSVIAETYERQGIHSRTALKRISGR